MKRKILIQIIFVLCIFPVIAATKYTSKKKIVVNYPVLNNVAAEDMWIADFVQGLLTTDLQNYSVMSVIDRAAAESILSEQKKAEASAYLSNNSFENYFNYANMVDTDYIVVVELSKLEDFYKLSCVLKDKKANKVIQDVSHSSGNISYADLLNGSAIHLASYDLLLAMGEKQSKLANLQIKSDKKDADVEANYNIAKGLQSQKAGNIVEAFIHFFKAENNKTGSDLIAKVSRTIGAGEVRDSVLNDLALYDEWTKIWNDYKEYQNANWLQVFYCPDFLDYENINYDKETVDLKFPYSVCVNPEVINLYNHLYALYSKTSKAGKWNELDMTVYYIQLSLDAEISFELLDAQGKTIAQKSVKASDSGMNNAQMLVLKSIKTTALTDDLHINITTSCSQALVKSVPGIKIGK